MTLLRCVFLLLFGGGGPRDVDDGEARPPECDEIRRELADCLREAWEPARSCEPVREWVAADCAP